jgi:hypothetical protein
MRFRRATIERSGLEMCALQVPNRRLALRSLLEHDRHRDGKPLLGQANVPFS